MKLKIYLCLFLLSAIQSVFAQNTATVTLPFSENFQTADTIPQNGDWSTAGTTYTGLTTYAPWDIYFGTNRSAFAEFWQGKPGDKFILKMPTFDFTSQPGGVLTFDWQSYGSSHNSGDYFLVKLSTDGGTNFTTIWFKNGTELQGGTCTANTWPNGNWESSGPISLPGVAGKKDVVIAFEMLEDPAKYSAGRVFIDNILVSGGTSGVNEIEKRIVNVYPNPSKGLFYIDFPSDLNIDIVDLTGKIVNSVSLTNGSTMIEINNPGIYFMKFSDGMVKKVVVE